MGDMTPDLKLYYYILSGKLMSSHLQVLSKLVAASKICKVQKICIYLSPQAEC